MLLVRVIQYVNAHKAEKLLFLSSEVTNPQISFESVGPWLSDVYSLSFIKLVCFENNLRSHIVYSEEQ
jgi:hypothetical protein